MRINVFTSVNLGKGPEGSEVDALEGSSTVELKEESLAEPPDSAEDGSLDGYADQDQKHATQLQPFKNHCSKA